MLWRNKGVCNKQKITAILQVNTMKRITGKNEKKLDYYYGLNSV